MRCQSLLPALLLLLLGTAPAAAQDEFLWIRYPAISPDGRRICFSYRGDLWLVASAGGTAVPFTRHVGYERSPVWSRDGKHIAFASDRHGNFDVFVKDVASGPARRLTHHSFHDIPSDFSPDGTEVLFAGSRAGDPMANPASVRMGQLYSISVEGGRARLLIPTPAINARWSPDGKRIVYENRPGRENSWRKHHTSSVTRDIWVFDTETSKHTQLTTAKHEDRDPSWAGEGIVFLSARAGTINVFERAGDSVTARTELSGQPVRFLSRAGDGTLCFSQHGRVYLIPPGGKPRAVSITGPAGERENPSRVETFRKGATQFAVSPDEKEVAFVVRGELFVASVEHGTTRRITRTATQERSPSWAPDGKALYFAAERGGSWNLYRASLARPEDKFFFRATVVKEEPVVVSEDESLQPKVSPDGKLLAFLHNRDEIRILDLNTKNVWTLVPPERNYSYADGDMSFSWSPDSKWLAFTLLTEGRWIENIGVRAVEKGEIVDMTRSGYWEGSPKWSPDGRSLLFVSNRLGRRAHGSWGSDADVFAMELTRAAHDRARLSVEELELREKKDKKKGGSNGKDNGEEAKKKEPPKPVEIEFEGRDRRARRVTLHSARLSDFAISPDGESLVSIARVGDTHGVWLTKWRKGETKRLMKLEGNRGQIEFGPDGKTVYVRSGSGKLFRVELKGEAKPIGFAAEMEIDAPAERAYIFDHAWRQVREKFYDPKLHGVDWPALRAAYEPLLAHIDNNHDFAEFLSELLGELNASHTGCYYRIPSDGADQTASLGLLFDPRDGSDGLKVANVLAEGPCAKADVGIVAGATITRIGDTALTKKVNHHALLNRMAGKRVLLTFTLPGNGEEKQAVIEPVSLRDESQLRYRRWVRTRRAAVEKLSKGAIGYVHVRGMNDRSFRHLYKEAIGRYGNRKALIVDTRNNGGGNLHDDLVQFLGASEYLRFHPRGKKLGSFGGDPADRWSRPVVVLVNELSYSDAHIFPWAFRHLKLGKVVGAPVAGTGTAVWWERQIDASLLFGIPQVGFVDPQGRYIENQEFVPDHVVLHHPESAAKGEDKQLEKAVESLLAEIASK
ncbi:MAG: S41 family peptidase [Planctomycetota bacterium]|jgi:Tol biopolymer transport system component